MITSACGVGGLIAGSTAASVVNVRSGSGACNSLLNTALGSAMTGAVVGIALYSLRDASPFPNLLVALVAHTAFLALDATTLAVALRNDTSRRNDALAVLLLIALAIVAVIATVAGTCAAGSFGA